jgi:hypothetical protein
MLQGFIEQFLRVFFVDQLQDEGRVCGGNKIKEKIIIRSS